MVTNFLKDVNKKNAEAKEVQFLCETQKRAIFQMPKGICWEYI